MSVPTATPSNQKGSPLMVDLSRRDVMIVAGLGSALASDLGFGTAWAAEDSDRLTFGDLDPLVNFLQETPPEKLIPTAVEKINSGTKSLAMASAVRLSARKSASA